MKGAFAAAALMLATSLASAEDAADRIADRMSPVAPRAATLFAASIIGTVIARYNEEFRYSDALDDAGWDIVLEQLEIIGERISERVERYFAQREQELRAGFVRGLRRSPGATDSLDAFLESRAGRQWREAESRYEKEFLRAFTVAAAYAVASPQRARQLYEPPDRRTRTPPLLTLRVMTSGGGSTPQTSLLLTIIGLLDKMEPSLGVAAADATAGYEAGLRNGLSPRAFDALTDSFMGAISVGPEVWSVFNADGLGDRLEAKLRDLAARAYVAADAKKTNRCKPYMIRHGRDQMEAIASGTSSVPPTADEYHWTAVSYEYGCEVERDLSIALRLYENAANAGNHRLFCKLANWYRLGVGTDPNEQVAAMWEQRHNATGAAPCQPLRINPENPWAGLERE